MFTLITLLAKNCKKRKKEEEKMIQNQVTFPALKISNFGVEKNAYLYLCYSPHRLRDSVFPIFPGFFLNMNRFVINRTRFVLNLT